MRQAITSEPRHQQLRDSLLATVSLLKRRRAAEINPDDIDGYVALNWLEWQGGSLKLTITGENICKQLVGRIGQIGQTRADRGGDA